VVTTLAGLGGTSGSDDGMNPIARFWSPLGLALDSVGNLFIGDTGSQVVRKITPDGVVTTIGGQAGTSGSTNASGSQARFNSPAGVAVDPNGFVYVTDSNNHTNRKGNPPLSDSPVVMCPQVTLIQGVNTIRVYAVDNRGQYPATNNMSVVLGGLWLTIRPTQTNTLVVSWPLPADGWVLEWTNRVPVVSGTWPQISPPYQTNAVQAWIVVPAPTGSGFYRLHKP
jgi:hypothetical protein